MSTKEIKKLVSENAALKRSLQQKDKKIVSITAKVDDLTKKKKALTNQLERSKKRGKELKTALAAEQKKTS
jgi:predicted  nucleic acid-binding Zn-ribbon protein